MRLFSGILALLLSVLGQEAFCADMPGDIRFDRVAADILPSNDVRKLFQDSEGYIWIPTYRGLARYDGSGTVICNTAEAGGSMSSTLVNAVAEGEDGILWVGTDKGVLKLDRRTGKISPCPETAGCNITSFFSIPGHGIWTGGDKGLLFKPSDGAEFSPVRLNDGDRPILAITSISPGSEGILWLCSFQCGLVRYNYASGETRLYNDNPVLVKSHVAECGADGRLWIGTWGKGLVRMENPYSDDAPEYWLWTTGDGLPDNIIYDLEIDGETVWVGSRSGLSAVSGGTFRNWLPSDRLGGLPYNEVNSVLRTADGTIWVGMLGGGLAKMVIPGDWYEVETLPEIRKRYGTNSISSLMYDRDSLLWMGLADYGLVCCNLRTGASMNYHEHPHLRELPYTSAVCAMMRRPSTGELCFGTWNDGVWLYDDKTGEVRSIGKRSHSNFYDDCIQSVAEDNEGNLWIGSRHGLFVEDCDRNFHSIAELIGGPTVIDSVSVFHLAPCNEGGVWAATNGAGVVKISGNTISQIPLAGGNVSYAANSIAIDDFGNVYAGTYGNGLVVLAPGALSFSAVTEFHGIFSGPISGILKDNNSRLWVSTGSSVYSFRPGDDGRPDRIMAFSMSSDNRPSVFNRNAFSLTPDGRAVFGGTDGFTIFNPQQNAGKHEDTTPVITDLKLNNRSIRTLPESERLRISEYDISSSDRIKLGHRQNSFALEFALLDFSHPGGQIFRYRLEGCDVDWTMADYNSRRASYNNLRSGRYRFRLQYSSGSGEWGLSERILDIRVKPSPWLSWWAWAGYFVLIALSAFYAACVWWRSNRKKEEPAGSNLVFSIDKIDHTPEDEIFMSKAMKCINDHLDDGNFSQGDFAEEMCVSRTVLTEKLKKLTGLTPSAFITDIRLRAARQLLEEQPDIRITDLAYASGFNDAKYFSTCFRKKFGVSPREFSASSKKG